MSDWSATRWVWGARYVMFGIAVWLVIIAIDKHASMGLLIGAENVKREIALAIIAVVYAVAGPDRWTLDTAAATPAAVRRRVGIAGGLCRERLAALVPRPAGGDRD